MILIRGVLKPYTAVELAFCEAAALRLKLEREGKAPPPSYRMPTPRKEPKPSLRGPMLVQQDGEWFASWEWLHQHLVNHMLAASLRSYISLRDEMRHIHLKGWKGHARRFIHVGDFCQSRARHRRSRPDQGLWQKFERIQQKEPIYDPDNGRLAGGDAQAERPAALREQPPQNHSQAA